MPEGLIESWGIRRVNILLQAGWALPLYFGEKEKQKILYALARKIQRHLRGAEGQYEGEIIQVTFNLHSYTLWLQDTRENRLWNFTFNPKHQLVETLIEEVIESEQAWEGYAYKEEAYEDEALTHKVVKDPEYLSEGYLQKRRSYAAEIKKQFQGRAAKYVNLEETVSEIEKDLSDQVESVERLENTVDKALLEAYEEDLSLIKEDIETGFENLESFYFTLADDLLAGYYEAISKNKFKASLLQDFKNSVSAISILVKSLDEIEAWMSLGEKEKHEKVGESHHILASRLALLGHWDEKSKKFVPGDIDELNNSLELFQKDLREKLRSRPSVLEACEVLLAKKPFGKKELQALASLESLPAKAGVVINKLIEKIEALDKYPLNDDLRNLLVNEFYFGEDYQKKLKKAFTRVELDYEIIKNNVMDTSIAEKIPLQDILKRMNAFYKLIKSFETGDTKILEEKMVSAELEACFLQMEEEYCRALEWVDGRLVSRPDQYYQYLQKQLAQQYEHRLHQLRNFSKTVKAEIGLLETSFHHQKALKEVEAGLSELKSDPVINQSLQNDFNDWILRLDNVIESLEAREKEISLEAIQKDIRTRIMKEFQLDEKIPEQLFLLNELLENWLKSYRKKHGWLYQKIKERLERVKQTKDKAVLRLKTYEKVLVSGAAMSPQKKYEIQVLANAEEIRFQQAQLNTEMNAFRTLALEGFERMKIEQKWIRSFKHLERLQMNQNAMQKEFLLIMAEQEALKTFEDVPEGKDQMDALLAGRKALLKSFNLSYEALQAAGEVVRSEESSFERVKIASQIYDAESKKLISLGQDLDGNFNRLNLVMVERLESKYNVIEPGLMKECCRLIQSTLNDPSQLNQSSYKRFTGIQQMLEYLKKTPFSEKDPKSLRESLLNLSALASACLPKRRSIWKRIAPIDRFYRSLEIFTKEGAVNAKTMKQFILQMKGLLADQGELHVAKMNKTKKRK